MDLKVILQSCALTQQGNYFIVVQLDELEYEQKNKKSQKFRSEVQFSTSNPLFKKNVYQFSNLSYGNKMTLKIGCFDTRLLQEPQDIKTLLDQSVLYGTTQLTLTVKILDALRIEGELQHESILFDRDHVKMEKGKISVLLRHKSNDLKAQVEDDVERIEQIYFDPFEKDQEVIAVKLRKVELKLNQLRENTDPIMKKVHFMRTAHKNVSHDQALLRQQKESLELENNQLQKIVDQKNDVKELHIHIDLLCHTPNGQDLMRKKLSLLLSKLEFERKIYHELSNHYYQIEADHKGAKTKAADLQILKDVLIEQEFHINRMQDQLPLLKNLSETMQNQEAIIMNLQDTIKDTNKNYTKLDKQTLMYNLDKLRNEKQLLKQKQIQLQTVLEIHKGEMPKEFFQQYKNDDFFRDNPIILGKFQKRAELLLKEIELLSQQQQEITEKPEIIRPQTSDTTILQLEIQQAENKAEILQESMLEVAKNYAKQIAELKAQLHYIEAQISETKI